MIRFKQRFKLSNKADKDLDQIAGHISDELSNPAAAINITKLHSVLEEFGAYEGFINSNKQIENMREGAFKRAEFHKLYQLVRPLLASDLKNKVDRVANFEGEKFEPIKQYIVDRSKKLPKDTILNWEKSLNDFYATFRDVIQEQVSRLTK